MATEGIRDVVYGLVDPMKVMARVCREVLELLPSAEGSVVELVDGDHLVYVCGAGSLSDAVGIRLGLDSSLSGLACRQRSILRSDDTEQDPRVDAAAARLVGTRSMVCVPLITAGTAIGVLKVTATQARMFDEGSVTVLAKLARFVSASVGASVDVAAAANGVLDTNDGDDPRVAEFVGEILQPGIASATVRRREVEAVIRHSHFRIVHQPIARIIDAAVIGFEALTRFDRPGTPPDEWFNAAHAVGLGAELELATLAAALHTIPAIPDDCYLAVNVSPAVFIDSRTEQLVSGHPGRVVLELTEHAPVQDYQALLRTTERLRERGTRVAADDTGAGISGMTHLLKLRPDIIKIDRELVRGIDRDPARQALAVALTAFANEIDATVIAEGIETTTELSAVASAGVDAAQGYLIGRPTSQHQARPSG